MMRQGESPQHVLRTLHQQHAEIGDVERAIILSSVTNEQRKQVLGSHSKNALCNHEKKKSLANSFIDLKGDIINDIAMVDPNSNLNLMSYVESISDQWKSKNKVKYIKNEDLIPCFLSLFDIAEERTRAAVNNGDPPPPFPTNQFKNNKEIKSCPHPLTSKQLKKARRLCACLTSKCNREGSLVGNSCIIMCRDHPSTDERGVSDIANDTTLPFFPWAQTLRGNRCTCPICMCNCNKLFYADDMQSFKSRSYQGP